MTEPSRLLLCAERSWPGSLTQNLLNGKILTLEVSLRPLPALGGRNCFPRMQERRQRPREERGLAHGHTARAPPGVFPTLERLLCHTATAASFPRTLLMTVTFTEGLAHTRSQALSDFIFAATGTTTGKVPHYALSVNR